MVRFSVWLVSGYAHVFVRLWLVIVTDWLYDSAWWGIDESGKQEPYSQATLGQGGGLPPEGCAASPQPSHLQFFLHINFP